MDSSELSSSSCCRTFELQQQGQLMAQEIEEQPVIGFQRLGRVEDEVGKVLLLLAQGRLYQ